MQALFFKGFGGCQWRAFQTGLEPEQDISQIGYKDTKNSWNVQIFEPENVRFLEKTGIKCRDNRQSYPPPSGHYGKRTKRRRYYRRIMDAIKNPRRGKSVSDERVWRGSAKKWTATSGQLNCPVMEERKNPCHAGDRDDEEFGQKVYLTSWPVRV